MKHKEFKRTSVPVSEPGGGFVSVAVHRRSKEESAFVELVMSRHVTREVEVCMNDASERVHRAMSAPFLAKFRKAATAA